MRHVGHSRIRRLWDIVPCSPHYSQTLILAASEGSITSYIAISPSRIFAASQNGRGSNSNCLISQADNNKFSTKLVVIILTSVKIISMK